MRYRYLDDFRRGISVFAIFSYGIAVLGTPQCPPRSASDWLKQIFSPWEAIDHFYSRGQWLCRFLGVNLHNIFLLHQYGRLFLVLYTNMAGVTPCKNDLHPDLCSATSSVWNICARFSDVISRGTSGGVVIGGLFSQTCLSYSVKNRRPILLP